MDIENQEEVNSTVESIKKEFGSIDGILHAIAFSPTEAMGGNFLNTNISDAVKSFEISAFSLKTLATSFQPILNKPASIVALDCSWKQIDSSLEYIAKNTRLEGRTLPCVLAANPVSWGKPGRLSTAEALALSLILIGRWDQARIIMRPFRFADSFFNLNNEPLEAYS